MKDEFYDVPELISYFGDHSTKIELCKIIVDIISNIMTNKEEEDEPIVSKLNIEEFSENTYLLTLPEENWITALEVCQDLFSKSDEPDYAIDAYLLRLALLAKKVEENEKTLSSS